MRCLRVLTMLVVLCGLAGTASAGDITVQDPAGGTRNLGSRSITAGAVNGTVTLNESGTGNASVTSWSLGAGCAEFSVSNNVTADGQAQTLPENFNDQMVVTVSYDPTNRGMDTCVVTIVGTYGNSPVTFTLTGTGTGPELQLDPAAVNLGSGPLNQALNGSITLRNQGEDQLTITSLALSGGNVADFRFTDQGCDGDNPCNLASGLQTGSIAAAGNAVFGLRCTPSAAGARTTNLTVTTNDPVMPMRQAVLSCTGTAADIDVAPLMIDFPDRRVGTMSAPADNTFTVANAGAASESLSFTAAIEGADADQFTLSCTAPCTCVAGSCSGTRAAGQSTQFQVVFAPTSAGDKVAEVVIDSNDPDESEVIVDLTGTGVEPEVTLVAPMTPPLDLGTVLVGATSAAGTVTIENTGSSSLTVSSVALVGGDAAQFAISGGTVGVHQVAAGAQDGWQVTCTPTSVGDKTTTLRITHDAPVADSTTDVEIDCTGALPDVTVSTMMLSFNNQRVGQASAAQPFTVGNAGLVDMAYTISEASADFSIVCVGDADCQGSLAPGGSLTVNVTFTPSVSGARMANITVATPGDPDEPSTAVMVTGTGVEPVVTVVAPSPAPLAIGDVDVGSSGMGTVTLRNSGTSDLSITSVTLTGGQANQFAISGSGVGAQTLTSTAGMNTRSWTVTCTPTTIGVKTTTFRVTHDAPAVGTQTNITVNCTGRGAIFGHNAGAGLSFGDVQVGQMSAPQTIRFTNSGNKPGRITMLTSSANVFTVSTTANLASDIPAGGFIEATVVFAPTTGDDGQTGQICALHNGLAPSPVCANVTGDGETVGIEVMPSVNFGDVRFDAGQQTSGQVTIRNTGESQLRINTITSAGDPFAVIVEGAALPRNLAANGTMTFRVRLTPTMALGMVTRQIAVGGVFTLGNTMASASINASARIVAPEVAMDEDEIDFGVFDIDDPGTAVTRSVTITNTADAATGSDLHVAAPVLTSGAPDFAIVGGAPATVPPGGSATVMVRFDPVAAGLKMGQVTVGIDALTGMTYTITLRGLAVDQNVVCQPAIITFPATVRRQPSAPIDASLTNLDFQAQPGSAAMLDYTAAISGANAAEFTLPAADAQGAVAGNASKMLPITFTPTAAGANRTATLTISYTDDGPQSCTVMLIGEGRLRQVTAAPATIDFGTVAIGSTIRLSDVASRLALTSAEPAGATATTISMLTVSGAGASAFTIIEGDRAQPLPMGGTVEYDVEFSPSEEGMFQADIDVFFDEDPEKQYTVQVTGRAVAVDLRGGGCDSSGGGAGALVGLAVLGLWLGRRRSAVAAAAALVVGLAGAGQARAQSERGELDISTFTPVASTEPGLFTVMSPMIGRGWALDISFHHDAMPLVADYDNGQGGTTSAELVSRRTSVDLGFAYALSRRLELGVSVPLHSQSGQTGCTTDCMDGELRGLDGASGTTLGDVAVRVKSNLVAGATSFGAALAVTAPTASEGSYAGSRGPTAHLQALVGVVAGQRVNLFFNGGLRARQSSEVLGVAQGTDLTYGAGAAIRAADKIWALAEAYGSFGVIGAEGKVSPAQFALGVRYRAGRSLLIGVGGGGGMFGQGVGSPEFRGLASLAVVPGARPVAPIRIVEDKPPPPPDTDEDGDGIGSRTDQCPTDAEDMDGFQDDDGCPDGDNDGDGFADAADKCPNEPEDKDGVQDDDGCVDGDDDGDGIPDVADKCPKEPEDKDGFNDNDGCDDPDNDGDGIIDFLDQCAMEAETINGNNDDDGCPDQGDALYMIMPDRIEALEPITFTGNTARLTKGAQNVLAQIGAALRADQSIRKIRVTVHVHPRNDGDQGLSDRRAKEVRDVLLKAGVEPERVDARGIGSQRPLVKPSARGAEQINDRVEFIIFERRADPATPRAPAGPTPPTPPTAPPASTDGPIDTLN